MQYRVMKVAVLWNLIRIALIIYCSAQLYPALHYPDRLLSIVENSAAQAKNPMEPIQQVRSALAQQSPQPDVYFFVLCAVALTPYCRLTKEQAKWVRYALRS
jgi:hypothetical protein